MHWLFEAKKRYGLVVLDFMVTSNHIHLVTVHRFRVQRCKVRGKDKTKDPEVRKNMAILSK
jgi:hypothetical protein